ncbi:c-type cytochrome [Mesobacterium pallidum]|uniref:c-type cytochrome n=1 Tax=Mesobacterium pallidum TaxID=2872037 RepID=UPI001EE2E155|nr:cytochrome c [Mesobacterium pallidum]
MRLRYIIPIIALSTAAIAADATDPYVKARQALMKEFGGAMQVIGGMAQGKMAFDAEKAAMAKAAMAAAAPRIPAVFEPQATDPESEALPAIWENYDDFTTRAMTLETAVAGLETGSLDDLRAGMGALGGACGACHKLYKAD